MTGSCCNKSCPCTRCTGEETSCWMTTTTVEGRSNCLMTRLTSESEPRCSEDLRRINPGSCEDFQSCPTVPFRRKGMSERIPRIFHLSNFPTSTTTLVVMLIVISLVSPSLSTLASEEELETISLRRRVEPQVLQRLESQFLKLFKMERRPTRRSGDTIRVPKYLIDMYESQTGLVLGTSNLNLPGRHTRTANTVRTFYENNQILENPINHPEHHFQFDLTSIPKEEEVTGAELRIPFQIITKPKLIHVNENGSVVDHSQISSGPYKVRVIVSDITKRLRRKLKSEPISYAVDTKIIDLSKKRKPVKGNSVWLTMDVFPAVARWLKDSKRNHGLLIQIFDVRTGELISSEVMEGRDKHLRLKRSTMDNIQSHSETPVLFTYSDDGLHKRKTRDARTLSRHYRNANENKKQRNRGKGQRNKGRKRNLCARHAMFVDFTDVGWNDWIVAPPGYQAHHCGGECPFPMADHLNATNHAVIQALVNSMSPQQVPPPCCVPTKYSSLSLLYTDASDKIVLKNYNEMIVDACGCS